MNVEIFVQNIKNHCKAIGTTPTVACEESGAGRNFMDNIKKGSVPSVAKVQLLASYLGVTTSELLGEEKEPATEIGGELIGPNKRALLAAVEDMSEEEMALLMRNIQKIKESRI